MQDPKIRAQIASMGNEATLPVLEQSREVFADEQWALQRAAPASEVDIAYGPHVRHRLDLFKPVDSSGASPIFVWVHGGGYVRGAKSDPAHPYEANVGRFAAANGFLGVTINYRLAPEVKWPSGGEDIGRAVDWLKGNAAQHGGDPDRIILMGASAGATHVLTYLRLRPNADEVCAAILLSGLYGYTDLDARDLPYYAGVEDIYASTHPLSAVLTSTMPLFVACAEFDPPRFQTEAIMLLRDTLGGRGALPEAYIARGHNHYSEALHIGGSDTRLSDEILAFANGHCRTGHIETRNA